MSWTNYHSHCNFCDGSSDPEAYILEAIAQGMGAYGFSSHAPLPFVRRWALDPALSGKYLREIQRLQGKYEDTIRIHCGLEVDYIPGVMGPDHPSVRALGLEYVIGSVHFIDRFPDGSPFEWDDDLENFDRGLNEVFGGNIRKAVTRYFELIRWMVQLETPDVVGHLDKIKRHNTGERYFSESEEWYMRELSRTLRAISATSAILEVNTRGLYSGKANDLYPSRKALEMALHYEIPFTLSSDSHDPAEVAGGFGEAARCLLDVGVRELWVVHNGRWYPRPFDETGVDLEGLSPKRQNRPA